MEILIETVEIQRSRNIRSKTIVISTPQEAWELLEQISNDQAYMLNTLIQITKPNLENIEND